MKDNSPFQSIRWVDGAVRILDQRLLPHTVKYLVFTSYKEVIDAIVTMAVRGAPAIGIAGAYAAALACSEIPKKSPEQFVDSLCKCIDEIERSRPTAVNLSWALGKVKEGIKRERSASMNQIAQEVLSVAHRIFEEDISVNLSIARFGNELVPETANVIHHCNTGSLATADYGTALGVIRYAHESGKKIHAYLDETRPRLQGAALSAFELKMFGVPHTVIIDSASGYLMKNRRIDLCIVGCDRVAANGDTANKIGTYNLALVAKAHGVPFYVACPTSTIDHSIASGDEIIIEDRSPEEVSVIGNMRVSPEGTSVLNPAFDTTPASLITAFITEKGVIKPPFTGKLRSA